tara:strand:- start:613 stop:870 length:258 start_codon:yes stop_codon:yes gene_type:complete
MFKRLQETVFEKLGAELKRVSDIDNFVVRDSLKPYNYIIRGYEGGFDFIRLIDVKKFMDDINKIQNKKDLETKEDIIAIYYKKYI